MVMEKNNKECRSGKQPFHDFLGVYIASISGFACYVIPSVKLFCETGLDIKLLEIAVFLTSKWK